MQTNIYNPKEIYVGRDFGGAEYDISPAAIENYIAATGDDNPWYRGDSPLGGPLAPALILHSAVFRTQEWYLPNVFGNLHARQEWEGFAPVHAGEKLHTRSVIVDRYIKRDREYVVNETLIFKADGQLAQRSRTHQSFLISNPAGGGLAVDRSREKSSGRTFNVGQRGGEPVETPMRAVSQAMCMAFSGPSRNYHTDRDAARQLGFPEIVVQGMLSVCLVAEMMTRRFGLGFMIGGRMDLRLVNVLWAEETTGSRGRILERRPEGNHTRAEVEIWCEKSDGAKTIVGMASAIDR
ncbi:MAG TPA: MaoC family dehydratase [Candidatus Binataceae bacterium]|nr:MaoC family dehydratase [Candidatus Binataceae bacterium]